LIPNWPSSSVSKRKKTTKAYKITAVEAWAVRIIVKLLLRSKPEHHLEERSLVITELAASQKKSLFMVAQLKTLAVPLFPFKRMSTQERQSQLVGQRLFRNLSE